MLGIMRKYKQSILIKLVFALIVLSFVGTVFLVSGTGDESGPTGVAATVNGTKITLDEFQKSYYRTRGIYEQIYGSSLSPELEKQMGIKKMTIDGLVDNVLIRKEAKQMGIKVTKDEVAAEIAKVPAFQKDGTFSFAQYQQTLQANRMTPKEFEEAQQEDLLVQKARNKVKDAAQVSDQEVLQAFKKQNEKVQLQFVSFSPAEVRGSIKPTDQELISYLQEHQEEFKTPEQVSIAYALVTPDQFASKVTVSPEEAQTYYQKNIDRYQGKGGILPFAEVKEKATADAQKQKAGKEAYEKAADAANRFRDKSDLEASAASLGATVGKTPLFTAQAPTAALAGETALITRAFTLKEGELGGPVETSKGIYLLKVTRKKPAAVPPLAQIRGAIEQKVVEVKAAELARKKAEEALGQLAKGTAQAKETGSLGYSAAGSIPGIGTSPELMEQAFTLTSAAPVAKNIVKVADRWYALKLKARTEAPTAELAQSSEAIKKELLPKKQQAALDTWLKELRAKAKIEINPAVLND